MAVTNVLVFLSILVWSVESITKCDKDIIENIKESNNCPENVPQTYRKLGKMVSRVMWKFSPLRCATMEVVPGDEFSLDMSFYREGNENPVVKYENLPLKDHGCGFFISDTFHNDNTSLYYQEANDKYISLYTCSRIMTHSGLFDGSQTAGCFFPVDKQHDDDVFTCLENLQKSMPDVPLVEVSDCKERIRPE